MWIKFQNNLIDFSKVARIYKEDCSLTFFNSEGTEMFVVSYDDNDAATTAMDCLQNKLSADSTDYIKTKSFTFP